MVARVLVVEDGQSLFEVLRKDLQSEGFAVEQAVDGADAETLAADPSFDVVVLDWCHSSTSRLELCRQLRSTPRMGDVPIVIVSSHDEEEDRVRGMEMGADDFVVRPFSVSEFLARVKACLRRTAPNKICDSLRALDIELDRIARKVRRRTRLVRFGPTEFRVLEFLMENPGRVLTRSEIATGVWGSSASVDHRTVDVHIGRVRGGLIRGDDIDPIRTVRGLGYIFNPSVRPGSLRSSDVLS